MALGLTAQVQIPPLLFMSIASLAATRWILTSPRPSAFHHENLFPIQRQGDSEWDGLGLEGALWTGGCASSCSLTGRDGPVWESDTTMEGTRRTFRKKQVSKET